MINLVGDGKVEGALVMNGTMLSLKIWIMCGSGIEQQVIVYVCQPVDIRVVASYHFRHF